MDCGDRPTEVCEVSRGHGRHFVAALAQVIAGKSPIEDALGVKDLAVSNEMELPGHGSSLESPCL